MSITWDTARGWRLRRHYLSTERAAGVAEVVARLTTIPAWSGDPELAAALRLDRPEPRPEPGLVAAALQDGRLIRTYTFGGSTQLMRPQDAGAILAIRAAGRQWEITSWRNYYALEPADWPDLRAVVRDALADGPLTRPELAAAVCSEPRFAHLRAAFTDDSHTFLKPFAWQGDLILGPPRDGAVTLQALAGHPGWTGLPDLDEAGHRAVIDYLAAYGPTTIDRLHYWFGEGLSAGRRRIARWIDELDDRLETVDIDGIEALCLAEHTAELEASSPATGVILLPGHDQWVRGAGTADARIVPPSLRPLATRGANLVLVDGVPRGSWKAGARALEVVPAAGEKIPADLAIAAGERIARLIGRPELDVVVAPPTP